MKHGVGLKSNQKVGNPNRNQAADKGESQLWDHKGGGSLHLASRGGAGPGSGGRGLAPEEGRRWTWHAPQVRQLQEGAAQLRTVYAGEHAEAIASREQEVLQGWKELLAACEDARLHVSSTADALRFHSQARDLLSWMDGIAGQIGAADKPRCPSSHLGLPTCLWAPPPSLPQPIGSPLP